MKRQFSVIVVLLAVVGLIAVGVSAQTKGKAPAKGKTGAGKAVDAAAIYKQQCAKCHAADGKGIESLEPPDMTKAEWQAKTSDQQIETAIKEGKGIMPGFNDTLSAPQISALVKFVRTLKKAE
ncbi:MAG TPA: cytochrome c [Blastocatellia bacterium]|nr:cytochrome c [Blastocatellia bacterium]HMX26600.1 cytochrome c [Blastocatellia bacterium]HMY74203.1 cytochrome c [Blastocatellia bacterium]HMZ18317.1 cytochrome c [Blastocatellia bacterium]HNG31047.1 cytochrome c [Blastocatellia bacterium]